MQIDFIYIGYEKKREYVSMSIIDLNSVKSPVSNNSTTFGAQNNIISNGPKLKILDHDEVSFSGNAKTENTQNKDTQICSLLNALNNILSKAASVKLINICEEKESKAPDNKRTATKQEKAELAKSAKELEKIYKENIEQVKNNYEEKFGKLESAAEITARPKSAESIEPKLIKKFESYKLKSTDTDACAGVIGDGYGARVQLKSLSEDESKEIITDALKNSDISYEDFLNVVRSGEDIPVDSDYQIALDKLKEAQTSEFVEELCKQIKDKKIKLADDEFNNYGDNLSSYFTKGQLLDIGDAYYDATEGKPLSFVNSTHLTTKDESVVNAINLDPDEKKYNEVSDEQKKKAIKDSGYTSAQMNVKGTYTNGKTLSDTELQVRGTEVNKFADVEHIPYDIRTGKIEANEEKYKDVYGTIVSLSKDSYDAYNNYLTQTYHHLRLKELGISSEVPEIPELTYADIKTLNKIKQFDMLDKAGKKLTDEEAFKLTPEGLSKYAHK